MQKMRNGIGIENPSHKPGFDLRKKNLGQSLEALDSNEEFVTSFRQTL